MANPSPVDDVGFGHSSSGDQMQNNCLGHLFYLKLFLSVESGITSTGPRLLSLLLVLVLQTSAVLLS